MESFLIDSISIVTTFLLLNLPQVLEFSSNVTISYNFYDSDFKLFEVQNNEL